jgi:hypothetical protein
VQTPARCRQMIAIDDPYRVVTWRSAVSPISRMTGASCCRLKLDGWHRSSAWLDGHPWRLQRAAAAFAGRS